MNKTFNYNSYHVELQLNTYSSNKTLYLALFDKQEGPITTISINMPYDDIFKDCPGAICLNLDNDIDETIQWLKDNGLLLKETNMVVPSGFCFYPVVILDLAALKEASPYDFEENIRPYYPNIDDIIAQQAKTKENN